MQLWNLLWLVVNQERWNYSSGDPVCRFWSSVVGIIRQNESTHSHNFEDILVHEVIVPGVVHHRKRNEAGGTRSIFFESLNRNH